MGAVSWLQWENDPTGLGLDEITTTTSIGRHSNYKLVAHEAKFWNEWAKEMLS